MSQKSSGKQPTPPRLSSKGKNKSASEAEPLTSPNPSRPPVVCFLGHVDHGKTSLLDYIRQTQVQKKEAGGITQSIGAYHVAGLTFIDTPGHAAFTAMRARGGHTADIAVLVVAADDGVMPQTVEAIDHIKAAGVPMLVAINKIDLPGAKPERVKQQLAEQGVLLEGWGGDIVNVVCSAISGQGVDELLEMLKLMAEMEELTANPAASPEGILLESSLALTRGPVATIIVKQGTLRKGQLLVAEDTYGRIKSLRDWQGNPLAKVGPGLPAEVLGLKKVTRGGIKFSTAASEKQAQEMMQEIKKPASQKAAGEEEEEIKLVKLVIKADTDGSLAALRYAIVRLENTKVQVLFVHEGIGNISEADVLLAQSSGAFIVGLKVKADVTARQLIKQEEVPAKTYEIIYHLLEDLEKIISGKEKEGEWERVGLAEVLKIFVLSNKSVVAGCKVKEGEIKFNQHARVWRGKQVSREATNAAVNRPVSGGSGSWEQVGEGKIASIKILKKEIRKVSVDDECGIIVSPEVKLETGDFIETVEQPRIDFSL